VSGCPFGGDQQPSASAHSDASVAPAETSDGDNRRLSRRGLLGLAGMGGAGAVAGIAAGLLSHDALAADAAPPAANDSVIPFFGDRQAGITTAAQDRLHMAAFDITTDDRAGLIELLKDWTAAAEAMTAGRTTGTTGAVDGPYDAPPEDTGEALDLDAGRLTITFGFGASLFEKDGKARFGLDGKRPDALADLPHFPGDALEPARTGGDIVVQACADDPQVAVHAIRNLARIGFGRARVRWSQLGFGRTSSTSRAQQTARNLFRLQGRDQQPQGRRHRLARRARVGRRRIPCRRSLDGGRELSGVAPHPDAHRDLGPHLAPRTGRPDRPDQGRRRSPVRRQGVHRPRLRHQGQRR
jgi:hypothetical protein